MATDKTGTWSFGESQLWYSPNAELDAAWSLGESLLFDEFVEFGTVCWGHDTSVEEDNTRDFTANWTGTGSISGSGDSEKISLRGSQYMESETWNTGSMTVVLDVDKYGSGSGSYTLKYKTGASAVACEAEEWATYSAPFASSGYVKLRVEGPG